MYFVSFFCLPIFIELLYWPYWWAFLTGVWISKWYFFRPAVTSVLTFSQEIPVHHLCV